MAVVMLAVTLAGCGGATSGAHLASAQPTPTPKPYPVSYTSTAGHFSASFPSAPAEKTVPASIASYHLEIIIAASREASGAVEVGEEDIQPALPTDQFQAAMNSALQNFSTSSGLAVTSQPSATTFRTTPGLKATFAGRGLRMTGLVFFAAAGARMYLLFAPSAEFYSLTSSFKIVG
jgi:hypothetical protein